MSTTELVRHDLAPPGPYHLKEFCGHFAAVRISAETAIAIFDVETSSITPKRAKDIHARLNTLFVKLLRYESQIAWSRIFLGEDSYPRREELHNAVRCLQVARQLNRMIAEGSVFDHRSYQILSFNIRRAEAMLRIAIAGYKLVATNVEIP
jgi:hypothetical protein